MSFEALIGANWTRLRLWALKLRASREDREDLIAATVARAWERFGEYDPARGAFSTWLKWIWWNRVKRWLIYGRTHPAAALPDCREADLRPMPLPPRPLVIRT